MMRSLWRLRALLLVLLFVGCVGTPEVRPRAPLAVDVADDARVRLSGRWQGYLDFDGTTYPMALTFDEDTLSAHVNGVEGEARAWLPTVVAGDTVVLVVVHETHLRQAALRFESPDRFRLDELYDVVFDRVTPVLTADSPSTL